MNDPDRLSVLVLRGPDAATALDWLYVHGSVTGVLEQDDLVTVWLHGSPPSLPFVSMGLAVEVERQAVRAEQFHVTGLEHDVAILVASDLLVRPPWVAAPAGFDGLELIVPRGGAFGSGEHGSTQAALVAMHRTFGAPSSFADIGTGSGILAAYAWLRGCRRIMACDIDEPSVLAARQLVPAADVRLGGPQVLDPADMVVSNMTGDELQADLGAILAVWTRRAGLVVSGLRGHEVGRLESAVLAAVHGSRIVDRQVVGAFTAVAFSVP